MKIIKLFLRLLTKIVIIFILVYVLTIIILFFLFVYIRLDSVVKKKYDNFFIVKTITFRDCNHLGCYFISFCDEKNIDYCSTLYKNDLEDKLLFSDKIKEIYIENDTLYVVIPKNKKYNIIDKNIIEKISNNKYKLDKRIYNVEYIEIVDK